MFRSANRGPLPGLGTTGEDGVRITRRQLLKLGMLGAGLLAGGGALSGIAVAEKLIDGGQSVSRTTGAMRKPIPSNCAGCLARCSILGFVESSKLVKIEGNPRDPNTRGKLCARGQAGVNRLYDPDRLLYPMERVGKRGEAKWVRLSWEQAFDTLEQRLKGIQSHAPGSVVVHSGLEGPGLMARRFTAALGSAVMLDETSLQYRNRQSVNEAVIGSTAEVVDVAHARYVLNFGGNPYESHPSLVPFVQRLLDARMNGAKLVTLDPRLSQTAGRSDEWLPVTPATDAVVALAMANVIVKQKLHDEAFLSKWTDLSTEQLSGQLAPYSPERAEAESGIAAGDIRRIATEFATTRPSVAIGGGGIEHQSLAAETQRAILLLNALVGGVGIAGGYCPAPMATLPEPDPVPASIPDVAEAIKVVDELVQGKRSVKLYVTALANPAYSWPDAEMFQKALADESRVGYVVAIDTNLTETSILADLVLPAATYLESWGLESPISQNLTPLISLRQPVVKPLGDSLSVDDILLTAGTRLDLAAAQQFPFPTLDAYLTAATSKMSGLAAAGGLGTLRERGVWFDPSARPQYRPDGDKFSTASGKLEFGKVGVGAAGAKEVATVGVSADGQDKNALTLVTYRPSLYFGDYSANSWWLAEITHDNPLLMHPDAARARRIKQGQKVRVTSGTGSIEVPVRITEGINPRAVALASSFGHTQLGHIARAERVQSSDPMSSYIWWQGGGVNASKLVAEAVAGSGGLAWSENKVRVEALG